jgi:hypothetical protein
VCVCVCVCVCLYNTQDTSVKETWRNTVPGYEVSPSQPVTSLRRKSFKQHFHCENNYINKTRYVWTENENKLGKKEECD